MTLLEILVALVVFLMMVAALVALATAGLDTWTTGEERKDVFDRAQRLLDQISEDLRNAYADEAWLKDPRDVDLQHAYFVGDFDANRVPRLRFVRSGLSGRVGAEPVAQRARPPENVDYTDLWEVAYVADPDPKKTVLYRGMRFFDRRKKGSILEEDEIKSASRPAFQRNFQPVDDGVLWISYRFWMPHTTTWTLPGEELWRCANRAHAVPVTASAAGKCPICGQELQKVPVQAAGRARDSKESMGPSTVWDSSRTLGDRDLRRFVYRKAVSRREDPDFCYPEIVQVTVVVESHAAESRGTRLTAGISEGDSFIRLDSTRGMPDGPDFVKIGAEWIEYSERGMDGVRVKRRGARGTEAVPHGAGERARFGETFTTDVRVPAFREAAR